MTLGQIRYHLTDHTRFDYTWLMVFTAPSARQLVLRSLPVLVAATFLVATVVSTAAPAVAGISPVQGIWSAIAPAIDGPKATHHTVVHFWLVGTKVENFGDALAGGVVANVSGESICSAVFQYPSATLRSDSFSSTLHLDGGEVVFKGTFTSARTASGTWEETGPCYTGVIHWTAKAGGIAPRGVNPATGAQVQSTGGKCSPLPCGNDDGLVAYIRSISRHAVGPNGVQEVDLSVLVVNTSSAFKFTPNALDFALQFASGKLSGWATDDIVKLPNGSTAKCNYWGPHDVVPAPLGKGGRYGPANLCFTGSAADLDGRLALQFDDPADGNSQITFPLG